MPDAAFPIIVRELEGPKGRVRFVFNFSMEPARYTWHGPAASAILNDEKVSEGTVLELAPWDVRVLAEE